METDAPIAAAIETPRPDPNSTTDHTGPTDFIRAIGVIPAGAGKLWSARRCRKKNLRTARRNTGIVIQRSRGNKDLQNILLQTLWHT